MDSLDLTVLIPLAVVLARLVVPLFIPAYPLPAILAAMVLDGVDQTIFSATLDSAPARSSASGSPGTRSRGRRSRSSSRS